MIRCEGWHDKRYPIAKWRDTNNYLNSCDSCKNGFTNYRGKESNWRKITVKEQIRAILANPFWALDRFLYNRGFRWKDCNWLLVIGTRIYYGHKLFAKVKRV